MRTKMRLFIVVGFFALLSFIFFHSYFLTKQVPLPFNLLVSFYSPWKYQAWPGYASGVPNKPLGNDNLKLFYPFRKFTIDQMREGKIPLWNPYVFSGNVHHATYQSSVFYPLNILYFIFPMADAWSLLVIIQPVLAGLFMYLFLRSLKLSEQSSVLGAVGFAFSGWMIAHWEEVLVIVHAVLWLPLALFASQIIWDSSKKKIGVLILSLSFAVSILAGFPQMLVYLVGTVVIWNIYRLTTSAENKSKYKLFFITLGSLLLGLSLSAIQWAPALESYMLSPRSQIDASYLFKTFLTPLSFLITYLTPDFWGNPGTYNYFSNITYLQERTLYVGLPMFLLAFFILLTKTKRDINFWKFFTLITLSLGFALPTSWVWQVLHVPILSVGMPVRIFILSTFGTCVLASYGFEHYLQTFSVKAIKKLLIFIALVLIILWSFVASMIYINHSVPNIIKYCSSNPQINWYCKIINNDRSIKDIGHYATVSFRNLFFPTGLFILTVICLITFRRKRKLLFLSLVIITLLGDYNYSQKLLYYSDRQFEYPTVEPIAKLKELGGVNRVWTYGDAYIVRNILSYFNIYSPEGYEALYSYKYGTLLNTISTSGDLTKTIQRTDATLSETGQFEPMTYNPYRLRLMSLLGVKYVLEHKSKEAELVLSTEKRFPSSLFSLAWENDVWRIWEYKAALPRAFLASQSKIIPGNNQAVVNALFDPHLDLRNTIIMGSKVNYDSSDFSNNSGKATIVRYDPMDIEIKTESDKPAWLFLSDTYYPGWKAYVDEAKADIENADFAFRAVYVSAGMHTVRFQYDPIFFKFGLFTTLLSVFLFPIVLWIIARKKII